MDLEGVDALRDRKQIIPVHALVLPNLIVCTYPARVEHYAALGIRLGVQEIVAFGAEVQRGLWFVIKCRWDVHKLMRRVNAVQRSKNQAYTLARIIRGRTKPLLTMMRTGEWRGGGGRGSSEVWYRRLGYLPS